MAAPPPDPNNLTWAKLVSSQTVNLTDITGEVDTFPITLFDKYFHAAGRSLIIFGVNIGMCFMVATVVLILSKPEKRRTPIFILNLLALAFQFTRMVLVCILYNGPAFTIEVVFLGTNVMVSDTALSPSYIDPFFTIAWYIVVIASLVLQVRVVFGVEQKLRNFLAFALSLLGLATLGFVTADSIDVLKGNINKSGNTDPWDVWVGLTGRILWTITVGVSSLIFVSKLMYLIFRRRKMGFKGFGPLHIIVIMGAQCLFVPRMSLSICILTFSNLRHYRLLRPHRWIRHHWRNLLDVLHATLGCMGFFRSRKFLSCPSPRWQQYLRHNRFRRSLLLKEERLFILERDKGNSVCCSHRC
jgi:pheromone alpha factor receptor